jgi:Kdo2-lipid IVA lauroyltransferase/acyltransferase
LIKRLRHLVEYGFILEIRLLDRILGPRLSGEVAGELGRMAYRPLRVRADVVEQHLRRSFPDRDEAWVRRVAAESYAHLGREGMSLLRLSRLGREQILEVTTIDEGLAELQAAVDAGSGAVVATGHLGNWEVAGAALAARGIPLDAVAQRQSNPYFDGLINRARARLGVRVIPRGGASAAALAAVRGRTGGGAGGGPGCQDPGRVRPVHGPAGLDAPGRRGDLALRRGRRCSWG